MSHITENVQQLMDSIKRADADLKRLRDNRIPDMKAVDLLFACKEATIDRAYDKLNHDEHTVFTNWLLAHTAAQIKEME